MAKTSAPVTAYAVVLNASYDHQVLAVLPTVEKAAAKALDVWNTLDQAITVKVYGVPKDGESQKTFGYNHAKEQPYTYYDVPTVLELYTRDNFSSPVEREIRDEVDAD